MANKDEESKCPVDPSARNSWLSWTKKPDTNIPASIEEAAQHAQTPLPHQTIPLATHRQVSSIPRGGNTTETSMPHHQHTNTTSHWMYPSEQQFYNAMHKKGWNVEATSVPVVLQIHNFVNERTWAKIREWESSDDELVLAKFQGRPRDLTPKAWFLSNILQQPPPFDRHDWYVSSSNHGSSTTTTTTTRYVIDYYMNYDSEVPTPIMDVRPALDSPRAVYLRTKRLLQQTFPGFTLFYQQNFK